MSEQEAEMEFTIPLGIAWGSPPKKRAPRATREIKKLISRYTKTSPENVKLSTKLNEYIWKDGIRLNVRKVRVKVLKEEETVKVGLPEEELAEKEEEE